MSEQIRLFIQTADSLLESMRQKPNIYNYQKPLLEHAGDSLRFFEEECSVPVSEYLDVFFIKAGERAQKLFKREMLAFNKAVEIMLSYSSVKRWLDKSLGMVLTVIESIKNLVSGLLDSNPLIKAGVEILEEAFKFIKE